MNQSEEEIDYGPAIDEFIPQGRSKRNIIRPKWHKDYITNEGKTKEKAKTANHPKKDLE